MYKNFKLMILLSLLLFESIFLGITIYQTKTAPVSSQKVEYTNVKDFGAKGDGVTDDTTAIKAALQATPLGGELFFPIGTYKNTGFTIEKPVNIRGAAKYGTKLLNTDKGNSITIAPNVERGSIKDISIFGNGSNKYGTDAISGKGIVFGNNSVFWTIDNVWMRGHGDWFLYADDNGNVNNITITNSEFEWGKKGAIHFVQSNNQNQINAINIENCNFSYFGGNIMELWGQSITVQNNTIQATRKKGVVIDGSISAKGDSSARSIRVENNYFEKANDGFVYVKAVADPFPRYGFGISVTNNYGTYTGTHKNVSIVEVAAPDFYSFTNMQIAGFVYLSNAFDADSKAKAIFNGHDVLSYDSVVQRGSNASSFNTKSYVGLGKAKILDQYSESGNSNKRPDYTSNDAGKEYFDTSLNKPIWWTGNSWVDANGRVVP
ncbi:hypothetical protein HPT25_22210 [Bacillus sp. BRMEA1]|uniref:glycosyl hydrolase family 28-related protein n=1 Tax=Neobacillus endophyticus TaxID=2738405 RepID=UPI0015646300|nr:glycosyl hydrolase family 28-related protein [Neobacillus endophyticus]NRD80055.1 hypothetical protein [Neobacillus endophyticus]